MQFQLLPNTYRLYQCILVFIDRIWGKITPYGKGHEEPILIMRSIIFWIVGHITVFLLFFNHSNITFFGTYPKTIPGNLMWNNFQFIFPGLKAFISMYTCTEVEQDANLKAFEQYVFKRPGFKPKGSLVGHWPSQTVGLQLSEI